MVDEQVKQRAGEVIVKEVSKVIINQTLPASPTAVTVQNKDGHPPKYHQENAVVGVTLDNYETITPSEDGKYVVVVNHSEHIELIKQPLTPEEKAAKKAADQKALLVLAGIAGGILAIGYWLTRSATAVVETTDEVSE